MKNYVRKEKILQTIVLRKINCVASKNVFVTFLFIPKSQICALVTFNSAGDLFSKILNETIILILKRYKEI